MIDFSLTEEEDLIRSTARSFAQGKLRHAGSHDHDAPVGPEVAREVHEMGFDTLEIPKEAGGQGLTSFAKSLVLEELGWGDAGAALRIDGLGPALYPLVEMLPAEKARPFLAPFAGPQGAGHRAVLFVDLDGRLEVRGKKLAGTIPWVPADRADLLVVLREGKGWVVRGDALQVRPLPVPACGLRTAGGSEIALGEAPAEGFASEGAGFLRATARIRLYAASLLVGIARASFEYAQKYTQERIVFGKPIAHHQAGAFMVAEMAMRVDAARLSVWKGVHDLGKVGEDPRGPAASAYLEAAETALEVTERALQLLGGHGYIKDHPVEKWMRDARSLALLWGGRDAATLDEAEAAAA